MRTRLLVLAVVVGGLVATSGAAPSAAGGAWMDAARDRYSPGEVATLVGYTGGGHGGGWVEDGPYEAWLRADEPLEADVYPEPGTLASDIPVGPLVLQETGRGGGHALRVAISFTVPDLAPGRYDLHYSGVTASYVGDIVGGAIWVDVDPPDPVFRNWPADEPARTGATAAVPLPPPSPPPPSSAPQWMGAAADPGDRPSPTTAPAPARAAPAAPAADESSGVGPGWLLGAVALAAGAVALAAVLRSRRAHPLPPADPVAG